MRFEDWIPIYRRILDEFGYSMADDETSAKLLKAVMMNADLIDDDELASMFPLNVTVTGGAPFSAMPDGFVIATGDSIAELMRSGVVPDVIVTDLDGDVDAQKAASAGGSVTVMHAHGDNMDAIMAHAKDFRGKVLLTTQSTPDNIVYDFGGFTDGDRAVCMARHFGCRRITLIGFDFTAPTPKNGCDAGVKARKLEWARRIIMDMNPPGVELIFSAADNKEG